MSIRKFNYQSIFRTIAIICILNSHLDGFWRSSYLASGGSLGNTMFFFISGFSLTNQLNISSIKNLFSFETIKWILARLKRLYYPFWFYIVLFSLINILFYFSKFKFNLSYNFSSLVFPTEYWFLGELVILYLLTPLESFLKKKKLKKLIYILLFSLYGIIYYLNLIKTENYGLFVEFSSLRYIFYAIVYFSSRELSLLLKVKKETTNNNYIYKSILFFLVCIICIILFRINLQNNIVHKFQVLYQLLTLFICVSIFNISKIISFFETNISSKIKYIFSTIAYLTFDIYLFEHFHIDLLNTLRERFVDIHISAFPGIRYLLIVFIPFNIIFLICISKYFYFIRKLFSNIFIDIYERLKPNIFIKK